MNNLTLATLNQSTPSRKAIIYLPAFTNFSRARMDVIYYHEINRQLILGKK